MEVVASARQLLVALLRWVAFDELPPGAWPKAIRALAGELQRQCEVARRSRR